MIVDWLRNWPRKTSSASVRSCGPARHGRRRARLDIQLTVTVLSLPSVNVRSCASVHRLTFLSILVVLSCCLVRAEEARQCSVFCQSARVAGGFLKSSLSMDGQQTRPEGPLAEEEVQKSSSEEHEKPVTAQQQPKPAPSPSKPSLVKRIWTKSGLNLITLQLMFKGAVPPTVALAMYQSDVVAKHYSTIGYLMAIISLLSLSIMPRAKYMQCLWKCEGFTDKLQISNDNTVPHDWHLSELRFWSSGTLLRD